MPREPEEIDVAHTTWVIKLECPDQSGYFCCEGPAGLVVRPDPSGIVQRFPSKTRAEKACRSLRKKYKLDVEEVIPEPFVHDYMFELWLDAGEWPDGIRVEADEKSGKRYLLIRDDGEEFTSDDLGDSEADALIRVLSKVKDQLRPRKSNPSK